MLRAFDDGRIFGASYGDGEPWILALHGWQRSHSDFDVVLGETVEGAALDGVALDLPGFGASPPPLAPWGSGEYAEAVEPVLEKLRRPAVVLGHSFGGLVALNLALRRPQLVAALVLCGVPRLVRTPARRPPLGFRVARRLHRMGLISDDAMEAMRQRHGSSDYRASHGVMRQVLVRSLGECFEDQLERVACPVELVWGSHDTAAPLPTAEKASKLMPRARLTVLEGASHMVPTEAPGALRQALELHQL